MPLQKDKRNRTIVVFIVLSMLLHALFIYLPWPKKTPHEKEIFQVERIILPDKNKPQIVDNTEKPIFKSPPKDSKYLSKYNRSVKEETKAVRVGKTKNSPKTTMIKKKKAPITKKKKVVKKRITLSDISLPLRTRKPSKASALSQTDDYLPEVKSSFETALNTREFKYFSYFERIKDRLRMFWEPELKNRVRKLYNRGYKLPDKDIITKLVIILNKNGEISKISVTRNSGFEEIDDAALSAFERAAPFPNPPKGMIEKDGKVTLTWSFVLQNRGLADIFVFLSKK